MEVLRRYCVEHGERRVMERGETGLYKYKV